MRAQGVGGAMTEHDRGLAAGPLVLATAEHVHHGVDAHVREVDNHADAIHLGDELPALRGQAAPERWGLAERALPEGGVGEDVAAVVRQGRVADAQGVEPPQVGHRVADLVQALDAEWRDQLALCEGRLGGLAVHDAGEGVWVRGLQARDHVDLLQCELHALSLVSFGRKACLVGDGEVGGRTGGVVLIRVVRAVGRTGRKDAPEGTAILTLLQSREVGVVGHAALGEGLGEVLAIDVVPV